MFVWRMFLPPSLFSDYCVRGGGKPTKAITTLSRRRTKVKKLRTLILNHRLSNQGKMKRELTVDLESITKIKKKVKSKRRRNIYAKQTFEAFKAHFEKPENGGYDTSSLLTMWQDLTNDKKPVDSKGVVKGVGGHKRYRVKVASVSESASESAEERQHSVAKKPRKDLCPTDASDFLAGKADFDVGDEDAALPTELKHVGTLGG